MSSVDDDFDPYRVLGLRVGADENEIQRRYRELVRKHHPDVSSDSAKAHQRFVRIQQAYRTLMDPNQRAQWERKLGVTLTSGPKLIVQQPSSRFDQLLANGRHLLAQRRLLEARDVVAAAIELDPFSSEAYRLLGDIYLAGGNQPMAAELYHEAELLESQQRAERPKPPRRSKEPVAPSVPERPMVSLWPLVTGGAGAIACLAGMALTSFNEDPGLFAGLGCGAVFALAAGGSASGLIEAFDELLGLAEVREAGRAPVPGAVYLVVLSAISPYLGVVYYAICALVTESYSKGILKIYAITFIVSLWAWRTAHGSTALALLAPSFAFVAALVGWLVGSFATPREWWRR